MRSVSFRDDVLWAVADKMGLDPEQSNFLTNQAIPIGKSIDQWVRRVYDARDWPEWVVTSEFVPASHFVPYDYLTPGGFSETPKTIGRVLKLFLIDPDSTDAPVETEFTLQARGIHCGYEHGTTVWIQYMPPPPRFTAVQWSSSRTYKKDEVVYSYKTGECYRSKVNNNIGHDPASTFSVPPHDQDTPPNMPPPAIEIIQNRTTDSAGTAQRNKIVKLHLLDSTPGPDPVDPPPANTVWEIEITDSAGTLIAGGAATHVATGSESLVDILTDLYDQLVLNLPGGWTITKNDTLLTIDIENNSDFGFIGPDGFATWTTPEGVESSLKIKIVQAYIPSFSSILGQPQITQITLNTDTTFPGATYEMTVRESDGTLHSVEYVSNLYDDSVAILNGILLAVETSTDAYWDSLTKTFTPSAITLDIGKNDEFSTNIVVQRDGGAYWELNIFPKAIVEQVVEGAYADLLAEWGQTDKAIAVKQGVPAETAISAEDFGSMPNPELSGQQRAMSRYRI